jgi:starvation-inducible DNA-binding protein
MIQPSEPLTMYSSTDLIPSRQPVFGQPLPVREEAREPAAPGVGETSTIGEVLAALLNEESALYAITRDWRYDTAQRQFVRLHALLDEQFSEIATRLMRIAARSRDLDAWNTTGHGERATQPMTTVAGGASQQDIIRQLLGWHETLIANLKRGSNVASKRLGDRETKAVFLDLIASHEIDAFMLRALLWEVENAGP